MLIFSEDLILKLSNSISRKSIYWWIHLGFYLCKRTMVICTM